MNKKIKTIEDVAAWQLCCGCGACAYVCPDQVEMIDALDYGRRPRFKEGADPALAQPAMEVCPGISLTRLPMPEGQAGGQGLLQGLGSRAGGLRRPRG